MRAVNLLPRDGTGPRGPRRRQSRGILLGIGAASAVLTALAAGATIEAAKVKDKQRTLEGLRAQLAAVRPPPKQAGSTRLAQEKERRMTAVGAALSERIAWDRILRKLALVLPEDVWLSGLTASRVGGSTGGPAGGTPAPGGGTALSLKGYTYSHEAVARFLARLAVVPDLANVQLQNSGRTEIGDRPLVEFAISAEVRPPGATS